VGCEGGFFMGLRGGEDGEERNEKSVVV
jgi:hypothetical protein